jgi:hypothetical protein
MSFTYFFNVALNLKALPFAGPHGWYVVGKRPVCILPEKADDPNARGFKNPDEPS